MSQNPSTAALGINTDFSITIEYQEGIGSPSRVFRAMADLADAFQHLDETLLHSISDDITSSLLLEDIQVGSLKAWFRQTLVTSNEDGLVAPQWRDKVAEFLIEAKKVIANYMSRYSAVTHENLSELQDELLNLASRTNVKHVPAYESISRRALFEDIKQVNNALQPLEKGDEAHLIGAGEKVKLDPDFAVPADADSLISSTSTRELVTMTLKVKSAVFIGDAMWDFRYDNHSIHVKILDGQWLRDFQSTNTIVLPGDAIQGQVSIKTEYDEDGSIISRHYDLMKVQNIIRKPKGSQLSFDDEDADF